MCRNNAVNISVYYVCKRSRKTTLKRKSWKTSSIKTTDSAFFFTFKITKFTHIKTLSYFTRTYMTSMLKQNKKYKY